LLRNALARVLEAENWYGDVNAPQTFKMLGKLRRAEDVTIRELRKIREGLNKVSGDAEDKAAAQFAGHVIDKYLTQVPPQHVAAGDPVRDAAILREAAANYRGAMRSGALVDKQGSALERAERQAGKSGTGVNIINTMRQRINAILNSPTERHYFSPEEQEELRKLVVGNGLQNSLRYLSKMMPAGSVSTLPLMLMGQHQGGEAATAAAILGTAAHFADSELTKGAIRKLAERIRSNTPLGRTMVAPSVIERALTTGVPGMLRALMRSAPRRTMMRWRLDDKCRRRAMMLCNPRSDAEASAAALGLAVQEVRGSYGSWLAAQGGGHSENSPAS
jgi:hypothetical protein